VSSFARAPRAQQGICNSPQYFICLKNGRWRPVDVPPGTLAVMFHGRWCPVFHAASDAEYFRDHPEAKFRLMVRSNPVYRDCFTFRLSTRDPEVFATGDSGDWRYYDRKRYATPREFMIAECERLLAHRHRCSNPERWLAGLAH
jgi:hypothetical protein